LQWWKRLRKDIDLNQLEARNLIISGGTQGLGRCVAEYAAREGASGIVICGRNEKNGLEVQQNLQSLACRCHYVRADLQYEADCLNVVKTAEDEFGVVHGLVNAAGITDRATIDNASVEHWDLLMNVNARAPFILSREVVRIMKKNQIRGSIVNMISDQAHGGAPKLMAYSASKGALATLTKNLAHSLKWDGIRVNGILLGWMNTPHEHQTQLADGEPDNWLEEAEKTKPFKRLLRPEDLAELAMYLLSDRSEMMTGSLIDFDQKVMGGLD
jgi:NAD(P)-dependent dehydrogenase (short-subunit alcohol dehydrogenase family)